VGTTATVSVGVDSPDGIALARQLVDDLSLLLSLARGHRIVIVSYDVVDERDVTVQFQARSVSLKKLSWGGSPKMIPDRAQSTKRFVQAAYQRLSNAKRDWSIV
jgi:hypothetical protein